jgi:hypothetical protein
MHPKKFLIFQGTRFIPLSLKGKGKSWVKGLRPFKLPFDVRICVLEFLPDPSHIRMTS